MSASAIGKGVSDLDTLLRDNSTVLHEGLQKRGISYSQLPSIRGTKENSFDAEQELWKLTAKNMTDSIMRLENPFGIAFRVKNQKWHIPPRMDQRGMNEETKKGHFVDVGDPCTAVFSIFPRKSFWKYAINPDQKNIGGLVEDFKMNYRKGIEWTHVDALLKDAHPLYKIE